MFSVHVTQANSPATSTRTSPRVKRISSVLSKIASQEERTASQPVRSGQPGRGLVDRAVGRTDQGAAVLGEEVVRPELERRAGVRASIEIGVVAAVEVDDEPAYAAPAALEAERRGAAWRHARRGAAPLA